MKNILAICFLLLGLGCGPSNDYDYEFFVNDLLFNIPASSNTIETHVFVIEDVRPLLEGYLSNQGRSTTDVKNIASGRATIASRFNNIDLGFIKEARIRLVDKKNPSNYQEIFQRLDIPYQGEFNLQLNPTLADIKEFIEMDEVDVEVRLRFRRFPGNNIPMQFDFSYAVIL